ncbi:MAG: glycosyltransferase [Deltaproteobacteria bacterium]|nr:glycosyltransferase [Deltaproteobacteria bacterium]
MKIAFMGIRGIPASYSGFETFVEGLSIRLAIKGHDVTVYNRSTHVKYREPLYRGVKLVRLPTIPTKHLDTITHTFLSVLHGIFKGYDIVYICGVGNSLPSFLLRLAGTKVVLNVDGADWERKKWGWFARWFLRASERMATVFPDVVNADSLAVKRYYKEHYNKESIFIPYGTDLDQRTPGDREVLGKYGVEPDGFILYVGRLVPENNAHQLIKAYKKIATEKRLVIVGDAPYAGAYKAELKESAAGDPRIVFTGYVFGDDYKCLMRNAYIYVLASEVGGTHPVLIEALAAGNAVIINNIPSSLEVVGDAGIAYDGKKGADSLVDILTTLLANKELHESLRQKARDRIRASYLWGKVTDDFIGLFKSLVNRSGVENL